MVLMIFFGFQYLTTVIPYDDFDGGPSTKVLLQLIESRCLILYLEVFPTN